MCVCLCNSSLTYALLSTPTDTCYQSTLENVTVQTSLLSKSPDSVPDSSNHSHYNCPDTLYILPHFQFLHSSRETKYTTSMTLPEMFLPQKQHCIYRTYILQSWCATFARLGLFPVHYFALSFQIVGSEFSEFRTWLSAVPYLKAQMNGLLIARNRIDALILAPTISATAVVP